MPKILENVKENLIRNARKQLLEEHRLSLRELAKQSGIATGTIYNYFFDKETILAEVMLEDWKKMLAEMDRSVENCESFREGTDRIYQNLSDFVSSYRAVWDSYGKGSAFQSYRGKHHIRLRDGLTQRFEALLQRFSLTVEPTLVPIYGELLLSCAAAEDLDYENYRAFISLLTEKEGEL